jgi:N12 class adenine-specific DNA methylase
VAENVFAILPTEYEARKAKADAEGRDIFDNPKLPSLEDGSPDYDALGGQYQVPPNIIKAVADSAGVDPKQAPEFAARAAAAIGKELQSGKDVPTALKTILGDEAATAELLKYADGIARQREGAEPVEAEDEQGRLSKAFEMGEKGAIKRGHEFARDASAAVEEGAFGQGVAGLREKAENALFVGEDGNPNALGRVVNAGRKMAEKGDGLSRPTVGGEKVTQEERAEDLRSNVSPMAQAAEARLKELSEGGFEIMDWRDIRGLGSAVQFMGENIATSLPQMGASMASGPFQPLVTITLLGGEANEELKERTELSEADRVAVATGAGTAMWALETIGLGRVFGGLVPSQVAKQALKGELSETLIKAGFKRSAARVLEAGIAEGSTEALQEGIVMGATAAAGGKYERGEVIDRLTSAFAGGAGAGAGLRAGAEPMAAMRDRREARDQQGSGGDGDTPAAGVPPIQPGGAPQSPPAPDAGPQAGPLPPAPAPTPAPTIEHPPLGPLAQAAARAPDLAVPDAEQGGMVEVQTLDGETFTAEFVEEGPGGIRVRDEQGEFTIPRADIEAGTQVKPVREQAVRFPDMKPGKEVSLEAPDGKVYRSTFLEETQGGVAVRIGGERVELSDREFDLAIDAAFLQEQQAKGGQKADAAPATETTETPTATAPEAPAAPQTSADPVETAQETDPVAFAEAERAEKVERRRAVIEREISATEAEEGFNLTPQERKSLTDRAMEEGGALDVSGATREILKTPPPLSEEVVDQGDVPPLFDEETTEPATGTLDEDAAPEEAAPQDPSQDWDSMDEVGRDKALRAAGYVTKNGKLNAPGRKALSSPWADLSPKVQAAIGGQSEPAAEAAPEPDEAELKRRDRVAKHDEWKAKADQAEQSIEVDERLPGKQAQGVPTAAYRVAPWPDGGYAVNVSANTGNGGFGAPFTPGFDTKEAAVEEAQKRIREHAQAVLADKNATESDSSKKEAQKILDWLDARGPAPEPEAVQGDDFDRDMTDKMISVRADIRAKEPVTVTGSKVTIGKNTITTREYQEQLARITSEDAHNASMKAALRSKLAELAATEPEAAPEAAAEPTIENIRTKAAVLRGVPKDQAPDVGNVSLKWDDREGGFIFSRKHTDKVRAALEASRPTTPETEVGQGEATEPDQKPIGARTDSGPRVLINLVGPDGLTDAERGKPYEKAEETPAPKPEEAKPADAPEITVHTTGGSLGSMTINGAKAIAISLVADGRGKSSGMDRGFKHYADQWFGKNRIKSPKGHIFIQPDHALDAFYFKRSEIEAYLNRGKTKPDAKPAPKAPAKKTTGADRPMADLTKLDYEGFDDKTREDGQNSPGKREARSETGRWARSVVKLLREAGFTDTLNAKGKKQKAVSFGWGMRHEPDETSIHLTAPNGADLYVRMGSSMSRGKALSILVQFRGEPEKPGYSKSFLGSNEFLDETMTPAEAVEKIIQWSKRGDPKQEKAKEEPTAWKPTVENYPFSDSEAGNPGPQARRWFEAASDDLLLNPKVNGFGLADNWLRAELKRRKIGIYTPSDKEAEPAEKPAPVKDTTPAADASPDFDAMFDDVRAEVEGKPEPKVSKADRDAERAKAAGAQAALDGRERQTPGWAVGTPAARVWIDAYDSTKKADKAEGWQSNKGLSLFKRVMGQSNNSLEDMRTGVFPEVAEYADWLGSLTDAELDKIAPVFRDDFNPFHGATFLGNGGIAEAEAAFAEVGVVREKPEADAEVSAQQERDDWARQLEDGYDLYAPGEVIPDAGPGAIPFKQWTVVSPGQFAAGVGDSPQQAVEAYLNRQDEGDSAPQDRSAGEAASSAAKNTGQAVNDALDGLVELFGGKNTLSSGLTFSAETYEKAKPLFIAAAQGFRDAGRDIKDVMRAVVRELVGRGANLDQMKPYVVRFTEDVHSGKISLNPDQETPDAGRPVRQNADEPLAGVEPEAVSPDAEGGNAGAGSEQAGARNRGPRKSDDASGDAAPRGGRNGKGRPVSGTRSRLEDPQTPKSKAVKKSRNSEIPQADFEITDDLRLGRGGEAEKFSDNIAAIETLKAIEAENRRATPDEQSVLARYVGWGGLANAFRVAGSAEGEGVAKGWEKRVAQLEDLLEPEELKAARNSTKAAHYTSELVTKAVWKAAQKAGFRGGAVLEPSVGIGNFLGLMPKELRGKSPVMAVEYDSLTARIAKHLYPNATVLHSGFQDVPLPDGQFALATGNPPFGRDRLRFQHLPGINGKTIHHQFFEASLHALEPGGILSMVVSRYIMDGKSAENRISLARRAELVGAIRLPSSAFRENARTEVVTDILVFRKHEATPDEVNAAIFIATGQGSLPKDITTEGMETAQRLADGMKKWLNVTEFQDPKGSGETLAMNEYFHRNPSMVVGEIGATGTMHKSNELGVTLDASELPAKLEAAIERLPERAPKDGIAERTAERFERLSDAMRLSLLGVEPGDVRVDEDGRIISVVEQMDGDKPILSEQEINADTPYTAEYFIGTDGKWRREIDKLDADGKKIKRKNKEGKLTNLNVKEVQVVEDPASIPSAAKWGEKRIEQLRDMLPIRDAFKRQVELEAQNATDKKIEANRQALKAAYDSFKKKHGALHQPRIRNITDGLPDGGLILAVEELTSKPGERQVKVADAPILSKRIITPTVARESAANMDEAITISLSETGGLDTERMASLLGKSVPDIEAALAEGDAPRGFYDPEQSKWVTSDEYLSGEVRRKLAAAERAGLDANVDALNKVAPAPWGPAEITPALGANWIPRQVYADFLKHLGYKTAAVKYQALTNTYGIDVDGKPGAAWATSGRAWSPVKITEAMMNSSSIRVTYRNADDKTVVDEEATAESQSKGEEIFNEFQDWAFADQARRDQLVEIFNGLFNTRVTRQRDGSHLSLPGANPSIKMRRHQNNAIWRGITDRVVLYDHVVGAGKTFTAIARVMERRRMGLSRKPMIVVPNHLTEQWAKDWRLLYPGAKLLVAGKKDFEKVNRRRLFARIAAGDYDAVIIGHSQITMVAMDPEVEIKYLEDELRNALDAVKEAEDQAAEDGTDSGRFKPFGVKEAERLVTKLEERMAKVRSKKRDNLITFQQMGVDDLTIDEAHEFKNLAYSSRLTGVSGMGNKEGSQKAIDLHLKLRSLHDSNASMSFLTGTPISNSVSEMYLLLRNLAPNQLREMGLENFDAWRSMFVSATSEWEPTEAGGLKEVTRLGREWTNMRTLMDLYYSVSDAVTLDDIKEAYAEDNNGAEFPVPRVKGDKKGEGRRMVAVKPGPEQTRILNDIVAGFDGLPGISDPMERAAERLRLMDKARKVALDPRAVDPKNAADPEGGKIRAVVDNIARIYRAFDADKGTQVVFLDRSVPKSKGDKKVVAEYDAALKAYDDAIRAQDDKKIAAAIEKLEKFDNNDIDARRAALAGGWNAYDEIKDQLVAQGIPEHEIAFVQNADTEVKKKSLFAEVRSGKVRVILGSTPRMGAGTNVQDRLVALHHVDVTWKPSDIEQREGRIVRQGNMLLDQYGQADFEVEVLAYATERTVDAKMWDLNGQKLRAINGIRKYDGSFLMEFEDAESASMAEMAALATGNPLMVERIKLDGAKKKLLAKQRTFNKQRNANRAKLSSAERTLDTADARAALYEQTAKAIQKARDEIEKRSAKRSIEVEGKTYGSIDEAVDAIDAAIAEQRGDKENGRFRIKIAGLPVTTQSDASKLVREAFGREGFEASVGGETFIDPHEAGKAMASALNKALADQANLDTQSLDGLSVMGMALEVTVNDSWGGDKSASVSVLHDGREVWENTYYSKNGAITSGEFTATLNKIDRTLTPDRFEGAAQYQRDAKAEAIAEIPEIKKTLEREWPQAGELDEVNKRLDTVIAGLEGGTNAAQEPEGEGDLKAKRRVTGRGIPYSKEVGQAVIQDLKAELKQAGIEGRVRLHIAPKFNHQGQTLDGYFLDGMIGVGTEAHDGAMGILRHEIIHALRDSRLWGQSHGLFTPAEWRALVRAARTDKRLMDQVSEMYPNLTGPDLVEEAIAEMYREWSDKKDRDLSSPQGKAMEKLRQIIEAIVNALRANGANEAAAVFDRIRSGEIGGRGPDGTSPQGPGGGVKARVSGKGITRGIPFGTAHLKTQNVKERVSSFLTDVMGGGVQAGANALGLVPGRPLIEELGKRLPALQRYLGLKEKMDADRQQWHAKTDEVAQEWIKLGKKDTEANGRLMDLMHRSTIAGVDPSKNFAVFKGEKASDRNARYRSFASFKAEFDALPADFQEMFGKVKDAYTEMADAFEEAVLENVRSAQQVALRKAERAYRKAVKRVEDDGLTGQERDDALAEAQARVDAARANVGWAQKARLASLRSEFESNRLTGPYFPLARFGNYFVGGRNPKSGEIETFSRFESEQDQKEESRRLEEEGYEVESGVLGGQDADLKGMVDPNFVADIQELLADSGADEGIMDAVWQRWLETLPDMSVRKNRIHRKGRAGFSKDALRAFAHHQFHGAHQLARLRYGLKMGDEIDQAYEESEEVADATNRNRATLVVDEVARRHKETMRPKVAAWASAMSGLAFTWYLAQTPAAAIVNLSQTTVVGVPLMKAAFAGSSVKDVTVELGKAAAEFARGGVNKGAEASKNLTEKEREAMREAHKRGIVDKTQAHDIAGVQETGLEYSGEREKWMKRLSWMFHKAEVANRETTFLASYRMARKNGSPHAEAIEKAGKLTWKIHFDYQHSSRPRFMQNDYMRVLTIFRQFTVNMLYRMARDTHQSLKGATPEERTEARAQLAGITLSMAAHAGITGVWGYGLVMSVLGMILPGMDDDDVEEWVQDALLLEGDSIGTAAWNYAMGMALKGVPGHVTGINLTSRIGMADLWFRAPYKDLEAEDSIQHYMNELAGPIPSIAFSVGRGIEQVLNAGSFREVMRGVETATPKAVNDLLQAGRYAVEGVQTRRGDPVLEDVGMKDVLVQAFGFTPAAVGEAYDKAGRMKQLEQRITDKRSRLQQRVGDAVLKGKPVSEKLMRQIRDFNAAHPTYPISRKTITQSVKGRLRYSNGFDAGANINPKLRQQIEDSLAPRLY